MARRLAATQRVLVVEDEHDIADFLRAYFRASGYDLVHIDPDTALEVLDALDEHSPDCVLLDLNLRGFNGSEAYRLLRSDPRYALLPVIVVSARPDAHELVPGRGGIDAFVTKPFNVNSLADLVVERIASAARLRESAEAGSAAGLLGHDFVEARLLDEVRIASSTRPVSFALVRLLTLDEIVFQVGREGADYAVRELIRRAREVLPSQVALGVTNTFEIAVLMPGTPTGAAEALLNRALSGLDEVHLPGGAELKLAFAAGVATFPDHASDPDGLYMAADSALADSIDGAGTVVIAL